MFQIATFQHKTGIDSFRMVFFLVLTLNGFKIVCDQILQTSRGYPSENIPGNDGRGYKNNKHTQNCWFLCKLRTF